MRRLNQTPPFGDRRDRLDVQRDQRTYRDTAGGEGLRSAEIARAREPAGVGWLRAGISAAMSAATKCLLKEGQWLSR
jgi:hypothetical protein